MTEKQATYHVRKLKVSGAGKKGYEWATYHVRKPRDQGLHWRKDYALHNGLQEYMGRIICIDTNPIFIPSSRAALDARALKLILEKMGEK